MTNFLTLVITNAQTVILAAISAAATLYVAAVWWRTKALVPTVTAIIMAGVVLYAVNNVGQLRDGVQSDAQEWMDAAAQES